MLADLFTNDGNYNGDVMKLMKVVMYLDTQCDQSAKAIMDLHEKGYVEDFVVAGKALLWVQEKVFIKASDFLIDQCIRFNHPGKKTKVLLILAVMATTENVKGIAMCSYNYAAQMPAIIKNHLSHMKSKSSKYLSHN